MNCAQIDYISSIPKAQNTIIELLTAEFYNFDGFCKK